MRWFPSVSKEEIMVIAGIRTEELGHTLAPQVWLAEGRQEGLQEREPIVPSDHSTAAAAP